MTKNQLPQIVVLSLLVLFGVVWSLTRQTSTLPRTSLSAPELSSRLNPVALEGPTESRQEKASPPPPSPARDPFRPPPPLLQNLQERRRLLEEKLREDRRPPPEKAPQPQTEALFDKLQLQGIFWGTAQPQAIINRRILSVGDEIEGAKILSISKDQVLLELNGMEFSLQIPARSRTQNALSEGRGHLEEENR